MKRTGIIVAGALCALGLAPADLQAQEPLAENTNNLSQIGATDYFTSLGWDYPTGSWSGAAPDPSFLGGGATVAILDGLAYDGHADLPYNPDPNADPYTDSVVFYFTGFPFSPQYTQPSLHATHVSGIVGARLNGAGSSGVAPESRLLNFAVFDDNGWIGVDETQVVGTAVSYGATVVNMSYGPTAAGDFALSSTLDAIDAYRTQVVAVVAAGNSGMAVGDESFNAPGKSTPLTNLIVVGSVGTDGTIAWYSNTPGNACIISKNRCVTRIQDIFIVAPGGDAIVAYDANGNPYIVSDENGYVGGVWSTAPGAPDAYYRISGTSMAAPHVAGAVALLQARWPALKLDPQATRNILFDTAKDLGAPGTDPVYGRGLLDVNAAMNPIGDPTVGIGGGSGGGGGNGGGGNGGGHGKKKSLTSWPVAQTRLHATRGFAALADSHAVISVFDDYNRDFPIYVSSLVMRPSLGLSTKLEQMLLSDSGVADLSPYAHYRLDRQSLALAPFQFADSGAPRHDAVANFNVAGEGAQIFVGSGNAASFFYQPSVNVGVAGFGSSDVGGVNPILGFASGDFFTGVSLHDSEALRLSFGFTENRKPDPVFDPFPNYRARALVMAATYKLNERLTTNTTVTRLNEDGGALGTRGTGAFTFSDNNTTYAITSSWDWRSAMGVDFSASYTVADMSNGSAQGILRLDGNVISDAFQVAAAKSNSFLKSDRLSFSVSQPLRPRSGTAMLVSDLALDAQGHMLTRTSFIPLKPDHRELDFQTDYSLALDQRSNVSAFAYRAVNSGHIAGETDTGFGLRFHRSL